MRGFGHRPDYQGLTVREMNWSQRIRFLGTMAIGMPLALFFFVGPGALGASALLAGDIFTAALMICAQLSIWTMVAVLNTL